MKITFDGGEDDQNDGVLIEEFCARLSGHYGEKNPYQSMDCKHDYEEVSAEEANRYYKERDEHNKDLHPGLSGFRIQRCIKCEQWDHHHTFKGYQVDTVGKQHNAKDKNHMRVVICVPCVKRELIPADLSKEEAYYYMDPVVEGKLIALGFTRKRDGGVCSTRNGGERYYEFKYNKSDKKDE